MLMAACDDGDAPPPSATAAGERRDGTSIAFDICVDNTTWTRPPLEEHRALLEQDPRYPVDEDVLAWYDAHFIRDIGSASEDRKYGWAGIWSDERTAFEEACAQPPDVVNPVAAREVVELWLLNYETVAVRDGPAALTVETRSRERGYQVIHFPNPLQEEGTAWGLIRFVDEQGREVAHIGPDDMQERIGRASEVQDLP
ncbi:MAG: hypothetical protein A2148_10500 [Chloroflexi bacterium RBG_16_68_14]|nr:MAG: hypothetical protein A2148_10500 [Chloroflexi bacterium RBG_16_68_14]